MNLCKNESIIRLEFKYCSCTYHILTDPRSSKISKGIEWWRYSVILSNSFKDFSASNFRASCAELRTPNGFFFFKKKILFVYFRAGLFSLFCQHSETIIFGITQPEQNKPQN